MPFSAEWLALREPVDAIARSASLTEGVALALGSGEALLALDLAAGTGANARYLMDHLPMLARWLLVDSDEALLSQIPARMSAWAGARGYDMRGNAKTMSFERGDERRVVESCRFDLRAIEDAAIFAGCALVTASALLDLVSESWLSALVARCLQCRAAVLFALTYDGRIRCEPTDPDDEVARDLVNRHQRGEKGFGAALGPDGARAAAEVLTRAGYRIRRARSDWDLPPSMADLQRQLVDGWAHAATAVASSESFRIERWRTRRLSHIDAGRSRLIVGHEDVAGWLEA